jgi:peptidyl-prolyl cis-trans isomerase SurA
MPEPMKKILFMFSFATVLSAGTFSQDEVLLIIDNQPVMRTEYERIYHRNENIQSAEKMSVEENLERFINFKLKVFEAEKLGYDTTASFIHELAGYRDQLSKSYLQNRQLIDSLLQIIYFRTVNEVNASHIMIKLPANPSPEDTLTAFNRMMGIRKRLLSGEAFEKIAREESDDPSGKLNDGQLGWFSAFNMILPFENAAYNTPVGEYSMPVRTRYGYHIIRVNAARPALGEIKLAHILVIPDKNESEEIKKKARDKIENCYELLQKGSMFADIARQYSEDAGTSKSGGQMRWLRSGELPPNIEDQVFALKDSGSYSIPLQSDYGWHIFQLQGKRPLPSFDKIRSQLEDRMMADERGRIIEKSVISKIKNASGFVLYSENIAALADKIDSSVYEGNWDPVIAGDLIEPVFAIGNREFTQKDLADFIIQTKRFQKIDPISVIVSKKSEEFIDKEILAFEKDHLEDKYPEFRNTMKEYHDGILLFDIMNNMVWNKAVMDTSGLLTYFEKHRSDYKWKERADVSVYTLHDIAFLKSTRRLAKKRAVNHWDSNAFIRMVCKSDSVDCISVNDHTYESGEKTEFKWKKGFMQTIQEDGKVKVLIVNDLIPPGLKSFTETRGQVTADYQNFLDRLWIEDLRSKYTIIVNHDVLQHIQQ